MFFKDSDGKKTMQRKPKKKYGKELVPECKGCFFADEKENVCVILKEPGWFWRNGDTCSFKKDVKK
jgi:hypothetical protein